jgi:hypothetical protein
MVWAGNRLLLLLVVVTLSHNKGLDEGAKAKDCALPDFMGLPGPKEACDAKRVYVGSPLPGRTSICAVGKIALEPGNKKLPSNNNSNEHGGDGTDG